MNADFNAIRSYDKLGTLTCFAHMQFNGVNRLYGISAAHVLLGQNRLAELRDKIDIYYSNYHLGWMKDVGLLEKAYFINGTGVLPEWGLLDAGTFLMKQEIFSIIKNNLIPLKYSQKLKNPNTLHGIVLYGYSVQSDEIVKAQVVDVYYKSQKFDQNFDLKIQFINGKTYAGDSGMLWRTSNGSAVAMHIYGDQNNSYATFISRVRQKIDLPLLILKT